MQTKESCKASRKGEPSGFRFTQKKELYKFVSSKHFSYTLTRMFSCLCEKLKKMGNSMQVVRFHFASLNLIGNFRQQVVTLLCKFCQFSLEDLSPGKVFLFLTFQAWRLGWFKFFIPGIFMHMPSTKFVEIHRNRHYLVLL